MNLHNYEPASDHEVQQWIEESIVEMSPYQKQKLRDCETVRFAPYNFMKPRKKVKSFWVRLSVVFFPFVWVFLVIGLLPNFLITGKWGYSNKRINWFSRWVSAIGL